MFKYLNINLSEYMGQSATNLTFCESIKKLFEYRHYLLGVLLYTIPSHIPTSINDLNIKYILFKISVFPGVFFVGIPIWYLLIYAIWLRRIVNVDFSLNPYILRQISNLITDFLSKISENIKAQSFIYGIGWFLAVVLIWFYQVYHMHNLITKLKTKVNKYLLTDMTSIINENTFNIQDDLNFIKLHLMHESLDKLKDPLLSIKILAQYLIGASIPMIGKLIYNIFSISIK
jgi:hypothetical protein